MSKKKSRKKDTSTSSSQATSSFDTSFWKRCTSPAVRRLPDFSSIEKLQSHLTGLPESSLNAGDQFLLGSINVLLGGIRSEDTHIERGIQLLKTAADSAKPHPLALLELAWLGAFLEDRYINQEYTEKAPAHFPKNPDTWKFQALAYLRSGDRKKCADSLKKAFQLQPDNLVVSENLRQVEQDGDLSLGTGFLFPEPSFGNLHHPPENPDSTLFFYRFILTQCLLFQKENQDLLFETALHSYFLGETDDAEIYLQQILALNTGHIDCMALHGLILEKKGEFQQAFHLYQEILKKEPSHPLANTNFARIMLARGVKHTAENLLSTALHSAPEYSEALSHTGRVLAEREGQTERAMECHRRALQIEPEIPEYHVNFCLTALQTGELDQLSREWPYHKKYIQSFTKNGAIRKLINLVLAGARDPMQNTALAQLLNENQFSRSARIFLERAWKKRYKVEKEKEEEFLFMTGVQALTCNHYEIGLEAFKALQKMTNNPVPATVYAAMALSGLGKNEEAVREIEHCKLEDSRMLSATIDIQWDAVRHEAALKSAMEAAEKVDAQFMPILKGVLYSLRCGRQDTAEKFLQLGRDKFPHSTQLLSLTAQVFLSSGKLREAISLLKEKLYKEGGPFLISLPKKEGSYNLEEDLFAPYNMLGHAFIQAGAESEFDTYLPWLENNLPDIMGEWETLKAENLRKKGEFEAALSALTPANIHPPAQTTRHLCLVALGRHEAAASLAAQLINIRKSHTHWYHPAGQYQAVACATLVETALQKGHLDEARKHMDKGLVFEPGNPALQKLRDKIAEQSAPA